MSDQYLGPYRLESKLGSGGMGSVFRAVHAKTGQQVAVKLIAEQVADSERFRRRFLVEVETLKKLHHPNIVRLIGYGEEQGRLFYSMDVVDGPSLQQYLKKNKRLDWRQTLQIGIEMCSALKHAHDLGVIHRDLKPANLLLAPDGKIQLVDFGIAKMFGAGDHTAVGAVLGTADYMAPEQAGDGKITTRTDLYALGSVLYACLAGRPPFGGKSITTVIEALRRDTPVPLDLIVPETPEELTELVHQLLEKSPDARPPTALVVGNRLRAMKVGLEAREAQTQHDAEGKTQLNDATNNDELEVDPEYLLKNDTAVNLIKDPQTSDSAGQGTHDVQTLDATLASNLGKSNLGKVPARSPTVASQASGATSNVKTAPPVVRDTNFQTVDDLDRRRGSLVDVASSDSSLGHWISIGGLAALLVGLVVGVVYLLRPPSADQLFASIQAADATGNSVVLKRDIEVFLRQHAEDSRATQVQQIADSIDVESTVKRLKLAALRAGGIGQLPPPQQAFLEAALKREQDPAAALAMFEHWLAVFGHERLPQSPDTQRLTQLATTELETLSAQPSSQDDQRDQLLSKSLRWGADNLPPAKQRELYRGVIALFETKEWAAEDVAAAKAALAALER